MVRQGLFREDLYYRLSTLTLTVPPLRERESDVEVLAAHFVARLNERFGLRKRLGAEALEALRRHDWPGNVRELLHVVEAAMIVSDEEEIAAAHLPAAIRGRGQLAVEQARAGAAGHSGGGAPSRLTLAALERDHIEAALRSTGGRRAEAARSLGISERNLYRKLREYGLG